MGKVKELKVKDYVHKKELVKLLAYLEIVADTTFDLIRENEAAGEDTQFQEGVLQTIMNTMNEVFEIIETDEVSERIQEIFSEE